MLKNCLSVVTIPLPAKPLQSIKAERYHHAYHERDICLSNAPILSRIQIWDQIKMSSDGGADGQVL